MGRARFGLGATANMKGRKHTRRFLMKRKKDSPTKRGEREMKSRLSEEGESLLGGDIFLHREQTRVGGTLRDRAALGQEVKISLAWTMRSP